MKSFTLRSRLKTFGTIITVRGAATLEDAIKEERSDYEKRGWVVESISEYKPTVLSDTERAAQEKDND